MVKLEALVQQPDKPSAATFRGRLVVQNLLDMPKSGNLPLSLTLIGGVDLDGKVSVAPK